MIFSDILFVCVTCRIDLAVVCGAVLCAPRGTCQVQRELVMGYHSMTTRFWRLRVMGCDYYYLF